MKFAVVGAGLSGCIVANKLAQEGYSVEVFEERNHVGGNCFTERDFETNVLTHKYGPHIFHTDNLEVWEFVNDLTEFLPYTNRVKAVVKGNVYSLPINLHTINQFFGKNFNPTEAQFFIKGLSEGGLSNPESFEDQALKFIGKELYEAFLKGYTLKQWGIHPRMLPASILKRLPIRFNYNDNYFNHRFQGMPKNGYNEIFEKLLSLPNISVALQTKFFKDKSSNFDHIFYTGPIDSWFSYKHGKLGYRTLDFKEERYNGDYQGAAVINYPDEDVPFTRVTEHKHFSPWEDHEKTLIYKEYSRLAEDGDIPYYPIRLTGEQKVLQQYITEALNQSECSFLGRLGTYRYLDMDVTILEALEASKIIKMALEANEKIPVFFTKVS